MAVRRGSLMAPSPPGSGNGAHERARARARSVDRKNSPPQIVPSRPNRCRPRDAQGRRRHLVLGHAAEHVRVVVLDAAEHGCRAAARSARRQVVGVRVAGDDRGRALVQPLEVRR